MTNVIRHARATLATLVIAVDDGELRMEIDDNGTATGPWSAGVGLSSMGERAALLGGRVTAGPRSSGGHVAVAIPLGAS
jgi:signal transduction histidine kinase